MSTTRIYTSWIFSDPAKAIYGHLTVSAKVMRPSATALGLLSNTISSPAAHFKVTKYSAVTRPSPFLQFKSVCTNNESKRRLMSGASRSRLSGLKLPLSRVVTDGTFLDSKDPYPRRIRRPCETVYRRHCGGVQRH